MQSQSQEQVEPGRLDRHQRLVLTVTVGAAFLASLDLFVVNVAFDAIGSDLQVGSPGGPSAGDLSWVLSAYAVVYAALLVPFGRLADRYGRRRLFLWGLVVFGVASTLCALSQGVWWLVGFRALQAVGAAAMTPTSLGILLAALPPERRLVGVRIWASIGAVAAALGPTVGGALTELSWRWIFLINVPVCALIVVAALGVVRDQPVDDETPTPDLLGAALVALAAGLLALGLVKSEDWGWTSGRTWLALVAAVVVAGVFARRSVRHVSPVIDPALLRVATFRWGVAAMFLFNIAFAANLLVGVLWLQQVWGWSVLVTGFAVAVGPAMVPLTAAAAQRRLPHVSPSRLVSAGCVVVALSCVAAATVMPEAPAYATTYLPIWVTSGIGVGLALPNLMAGSTHDLPGAMAATGSGVVTMARQIGFVVGVSMLFAVVGDRTGVAAVESFRTVWFLSALALVAAGVAALGMRHPRHVPTV